MGDHLGTARIAAAQAASIFLDRERSADRAVELIAEAGQMGVDLLVFPEGFIPAHPIWYHFHPATGRASLAMARELFLNSVEIPGPTITRVAEAAGAAAVAVVLGVCEKRPGTTGTMYNTQVFIDGTGAFLGTHQKLMPTLGERVVHAGGYGDTLAVYRFELGLVGGLICGENSNALATHTLAELGAVVHAASWPPVGSSPNEGGMDDFVAVATRSLASRNGCFVVNACGVISPEMVDQIAYRLEDREYLEQRNFGPGSSIIDPHGHMIAGPMDGAEEGLLVADIDLDECVAAKITHDYTGHYNRSDVFTLRVNPAKPALYERLEPLGPQGDGEPPIEAGGDDSIASSGI